MLNHLDLATNFQEAMLGKVISVYGKFLDHTPSSSCFEECFVIDCEKVHYFNSSDSKLKND